MKDRRSEQIFIEPYLEFLEIIADWKNSLYREDRFFVPSATEISQLDPLTNPLTNPSIKPSRQPENEMQKSTEETKRTKSAFLQNELKVLKQEVESCKLCPLSETRSQTVFARGNPKSPVMIIGEAPGKEEDQQGFPFVGRAGKLLDKMLLAIQIEPNQVYIANLLKCRPPQNRNPKQEEILLCSAYLERQIRLVAPKIILTLGNFATKFILKNPEGISQVRGKAYDWESSKNPSSALVFPLYHPSALLQNPNLKRPAWEDLKTLKRLLQEKGWFPS